MNSMVDMDIIPSEHPRGRKPTFNDLMKLQEALEQYGYYRIPYDRHRNLLHAWDCEKKPYDSWYGYDSIVIVHPMCNDCGLDCHEHSQEFLQAMIPVIGKLDALAYYEPGEKYKLGPRLRIYL